MEARDTRGMAASCPTRPVPVKVALRVLLLGLKVPALSCAPRTTALVPWETLLMKAGPPPAVDWSVFPGAGVALVGSGLLYPDQCRTPSVEGPPAGELCAFAGSVENWASF